MLIGQAAQPPGENLRGPWAYCLLGSGKSELMKAFSASVAQKDPSANNIYIDLLDLDNEPLLEYHGKRHNCRVGYPKTS